MRSRRYSGDRGEIYGRYRGVKLALVEVGALSPSTQTLTLALTLTLTLALSLIPTLTLTLALTLAPTPNPNPTPNQGALGMYWTRSLYGDRMVQPSQFQP